MMTIQIPHAVLRGTYHFTKGAGGQWYSPNKDSDVHVHLIGKNWNPGYDPVNNPRAPEVLSVAEVELKVTQRNRWWGVPQVDGTFFFDPAVIAEWGLGSRRGAKDLMARVPAPLCAS